MRGELPRRLGGNRLCRPHRHRKWLAWSRR